MEQLDRSIAQAERSYEQIRHDAARRTLRAVQGAVERLQKPSTRFWLCRAPIARPRRLPLHERLTIGVQRGERHVGPPHRPRRRERAGSERPSAVAYRQALLARRAGDGIAGVMVVAALFYISRSISTPLLQLADACTVSPSTTTDITSRHGAARRDRGDGAGRRRFRNNAIELMRSQRVLAQQASMLEEKLAQEQRWLCSNATSCPWPHMNSVRL